MRSPPAAIPSHAAVCASTGLLQALNRDEIAGVMAHELAHIKNHDTLTMTIAASIGGAISMLAQYMQFGAMFGGHRDDRSGVGMIGTLVAIIVAPLAAMLVQMAISRSREYSADRMGAADQRPAAVAGLGACQDPELRAPHTQRGGGGRTRDGAHVHHQPACRDAAWTICSPRTPTPRTASPSSRRMARETGQTMGPSDAGALPATRGRGHGRRRARATLPAVRGAEAR